MSVNIETKATYIPTFDSYDTVQDIVDEIKFSLLDLEEKYGVHIQIGATGSTNKINYTEHKLHFTLEVHSKDRILNYDKLKNKIELPKILKRDTKNTKDKEDIDYSFINIENVEKQRWSKYDNIFKIIGFDDQSSKSPFLIEYINNKKEDKILKMWVSPEYITSSAHLTPEYLY